MKKTKRTPAKKSSARKASTARKRSVKAKATKKTALKKAPAKKKVAAKKTSVKRPAAKKAKTLTATDQVLKVIKRSKKGVNVPMLVNKTGFKDKKIRDIVYRTFKQGRIKRVGTGLYVGA
jgi:hypothetical protein